MKKRILSLVTALALCLSMLPVGVLALEPEADTGLCPHHTEHTAECGYAAPTKGQPCAHQHDETCSYAEAAAETPCDKECVDEDGDGEIDHAVDCAYAPAVEGQDCTHEHDDACGYVEAGPGQPCGYECRICAVQVLIDTLPDAGDITAENAEDVAAQLDEIDAAKLDLTDEEADELDIDRYMAAAAALNALNGQAGAEEPAPLEDREAITTFDELKTAISNATGTKDIPTEIVISGSIAVTEMLAISGKHIKLTGGTLTCAGLKSHMFTISGSGSLTLENVTLDGTDHAPAQDSKTDLNLVWIGAGELILNEGAILENNGDTAIYMNGSAILTMNDGEIRNNTDMRDNGCGAAIYTPNLGASSTRPTINIMGGKITGNSVGRSGGAIYLTSYCNLNISGGEITGNSAAVFGGGIYIHKEYTQNTDPIFITGGTIEGNTSGSTGANICTERDIVLGPDANIPAGIKLGTDRGTANHLILTGTPKYPVGLEYVGSSGSANWYSVVKMRDDTAVSEAAFQMLVMTDPAQSLVLAEDGMVHIGTKISGDYPLDFTYSVWEGDSGSDNGTVGSQSGVGWSWDADTLTLTITDDVRAIATGTTRALSLPKGDVIIDIADGKTLTVESPDWYALDCLGSLTITGNGTISTVSGDQNTGGINASGDLSVTGTNLNLTGTSYYLLHTWGALTLENSEVSVVSKTSDSDLALGIYASDDIVIENCKINVDLKLDETCSTEDEDAGVYGIATLKDISISKSEVTINTENYSPDKDSYNYGIISYGDISIEDESQITVTTADSSQPIGIVAVGKMAVDNSTVKSTTTNSVEDGFALEMISYKEFTLTGVEVVQGQKYILDDDEGYEEDITNYAWNTEDEEDYPKGGTSIIGYPVTGVTLNKDTLDLNVGNSETLTATVKPTNATNQSVTWTSSNKAVAAVDENGNVTAVAPGTATITVTTLNGRHTATCEITVKQVQNITITADNKTAYVGSPLPELTYKVSGLVNGDTLTTPPTLTCNADMTKAGTYPITVSGASASENYTITYTDGTLTVTDKLIPSVTISAVPTALTGGGTVTLTVTGLPAEGEATVTCSEESIVLTPGADNTWTAELPNAAAQYIFTVNYAGSTQYAAVTDSCTVSVTRQASGGGGGSNTYPVTVEDASHGTVKTDRTRASSGTAVTITVTPDSGYELDALTVTDSRGNELTLTDKGNGRYTFKMPSGKVTVEAVFTAMETGHDCPSLDFTDLDITAWYHEAVDYALENGMMSGYGSGVFGPNNSLSRAMLCQILYNLEDRPATGQSAFDDVANTAWYADAVTWANANGIVSGYGDGCFGPNDAITREQLATILWRYAQFKGYDTTQGGMAIREFSDYETISDYAVDAMTWAVNTGVVGGYEDKTLRPRNGATRAQVAQMLMNFLKIE